MICDWFWVWVNNSTSTWNSEGDEAFIGVYDLAKLNSVNLLYENSVAGDNLVILGN